MHTPTFGRLRSVDVSVFRDSHEPYHVVKIVAKWVSVGGTIEFDHCDFMIQEDVSDDVWKAVKAALERAQQQL